MINKLSLAVSNSETFGTIEFAPTDSCVTIFDDRLELRNCFIDWCLPQNEHVDELIRGQKVSLQRVIMISFDEIAKAALYEDGVHIERGRLIADVAFDDAELYEEIELLNKTEYIKNHVIGAYTIMGNESKHLRVF